MADSAKSTGDVDPLSWIREHWAIVGAIVFVLFALWVASGESHRESGRYMLVKDDVPCQSVGESNARRWCYVVLDTRTGKLEERTRKLAGTRGDE